MIAHQITNSTLSVQNCERRSRHITVAFLVEVFKVTTYNYKPSYGSSTPVKRTHKQNAHIRDIQDKLNVN